MKVGVFMAREKYLAVDFGAGSGRVMLGTFDGERFALEELHRFDNPQSKRAGHIRWDVEYLFRQMKDGSLSSLFINKRGRLPLNVWMDAEDHPTKGYAHRPGWHCLLSPKAPHLKMKNRVWVLAEIENYKIFSRPINQGGKWALAQRMRILKIL